MGQRATKFVKYAAIAFIAMAALPCVSLAQGVNPFTFTFNPSPAGERTSYQNVICSITGMVNHNCTPYSNPTVQQNTWVNQNQWYWYGNMASDFQTRFVQEIININGIDYYHLVIGDPASGFGQEIYIARTTDFRRSENGSEGIYSDSGGTACFPGINISNAAIAEGCIKSNNAADPLRQDSMFTGNGTGNPSRMVMKQVLNGVNGEFSQEFLKATLANKPKITQISNDNTMNSVFVMDMSNSNYNTDTLAGTMINTFDLTSPALTGNLGDFNFTPTAGTNITAGRYKFQRVQVTNHQLENGWVRDVPTSVYTYYDGTVDPVLNVDWAAFRDPTQNPP